MYHFSLQTLALALHVIFHILCNFLPVLFLIVPDIRQLVKQYKAQVSVTEKWLRDLRKREEENISLKQVRLWCIMYHHSMMCETFLVCLIMKPMNDTREKVV